MQDRPQDCCWAAAQTCSTGCLITHEASNRFVMNQLNERLGQFIAAREIDRMSNPDLRVARLWPPCSTPLLYPGVGQILRITQQELAKSVTSVASACERGAVRAAARARDPDRVWWPRAPGPEAPRHGEFCVAQGACPEVRPITQLRAELWITSPAQRRETITPKMSGQTPKEFPALWCW